MSHKNHQKSSVPNQGAPQWLCLLLYVALHPHQPWYIYAVYPSGPRTCAAERAPTLLRAAPAALRAEREVEIFAVLFGFFGFEHAVNAQKKLESRPMMASVLPQIYGKIWDVHFFQINDLRSCNHEKLMAKKPCLDVNPISTPSEPANN